ncbi:DNA primase TraC [compost metagenome]
MDLLNQGIIPWRRPWINGGAVNWKTQKPYRGINVFLLDPGEYATYKQIAEAGGRVKKGQKGHFIVFWTWLEKKSDDEEEKTKRIPFLRHYIVFEINKQCEGLTFIDHQRTLLVSHL